MRRRVKRMPAWSTVGVWSLRSVVKGGEMTMKGIKEVFHWCVSFCLNKGLLYDKK
jgi:hypothetical protein